MRKQGGQPFLGHRAERGRPGKAGRQDRCFHGGSLLQALGAQPLGASRRLRATPQNRPLPGGDYPPTGDRDSPTTPHRGAQQAGHCVGEPSPPQPLREPCWLRGILPGEATAPVSEIRGRGPGWSHGPARRLTLLGLAARCALWDTCPECPAARGRLYAGLELRVWKRPKGLPCPSRIQGGHPRGRGMGHGQLSLGCLANMETSLGPPEPVGRGLMNATTDLHGPGTFLRTPGCPGLQRDSHGKVSPSLLETPLVIGWDTHNPGQ